MPAASNQLQGRFPRVEDCTLLTGLAPAYSGSPSRQLRPRDYLTLSRRAIATQIPEACKAPPGHQAAGTRAGSRVSSATGAGRSGEAEADRLRPLHKHPPPDPGQLAQVLIDLGEDVDRLTGVHGEAARDE